MKYDTTFAESFARGAASSRGKVTPLRKRRCARNRDAYRSPTTQSLGPGWTSAHPEIDEESVAPETYFNRGLPMH